MSPTLSLVPAECAHVRERIGNFVCALGARDSVQLQYLLKQRVRQLQDLLKEIMITIAVQKFPSTEPLGSFAVELDPHTLQAQEVTFTHTIEGGFVFADYRPLFNRVMAIFYDVLEITPQVDRREEGMGTQTHSQAVDIPLPSSFSEERAPSFATTLSMPSENSDWNLSTPSESPIDTVF